MYSIVSNNTKSRTEMETPSATRRVTRSQTQSKKFEVCEMNATESRKHKNQAALIDITNESPIIGLAKSSYFETPSSAISKKMNSKIKIETPGSGEALLRDQVKTLLEKVEEEAEFPRIIQENKPFNNFHGFVNSPLNILAPTPANTPQITALSDAGIMELDSVTPSIVEDKLFIPQTGSAIFGEKNDFVTKTLLFEFTEKLDGCDSSEERKEKLFTDEEDEDGASVWSIQVNVSSTKDELEDDEEVVEKSGCNDVEDELCEGLGKISFVNEKTTKTGKHMRFVYDSDGEFVEVEEETALLLKGLPKPKGKHIHFQEEDDVDTVQD